MNGLKPSTLECGIRLVPFLRRGKIMIRCFSPFPLANDERTEWVIGPYEKCIDGVYIPFYSTLKGVQHE